MEQNEIDVTSPVAAEKDWVNIAFLTLTPVVGIVGTALYTWKVGFQPWMAALLGVMYLLVGLSICAGYHRLFSHRSYSASPLVQIFYAFFGAMAAQNSILWWSSSHRVHHSYQDRDWDPYNIKRGFWWAHILWIFHRNPQSGNFSNARDLEANKVVQWQHRWHKHILILGGFGIPTLIGWAFGDAVAGLLWGGFLRVVVIHHTTFFVNSLAHFWGRREFNHEATARDNWMVALVTLGEGYHSFHHRFPTDFRNGIRWYHWDPSKWFIGALRSVGLASFLRIVPAPVIEQARMEAALDRVKEQIDTGTGGRFEEIRQRITTARESLEASLALWKQHVEEKARGASGRVWRPKRRGAKVYAMQARREWRAALRLLDAA